MSHHRDVRSLGTILGVWAHPDDEVFLSGGLMARAASAGQRVVVVTATRGERGTSDPDTWPPDRLGRLRERELEVCLGILGVTEHHQLGHPDGGCSSVPADVGAGQVAEIISAVAPDTVLTFGPDGYTGHADHRTVSGWVDAALATSESGARVLHATTDRRTLGRFADVHEQFGVFFAGEPSVTAIADMPVRLRLHGASLDRKVEALRSQQSQTTGLIAGMGEQRFRSWVATESFRHHSGRILVQPVHTASA